MNKNKFKSVNKHISMNKTKSKSINKSISMNMSIPKNTYNIWETKNQLDERDACRIIKVGNEER